MEQCGCGPTQDPPGHWLRPSTRRDFLRVGVLAGLGLSLGDYFRMRDAYGADAAPTGPPPAAESVIFIFMAGGMSHLDTFDPKPYAPVEYRGELGTVPTTNGDVFSGLLPNLAKVADKMTVIRSMTHGEAAHERGTHNMLTGYRPSPALVYPSIGSVVAHEYGPRKDIPPYICIPSAGDATLGTGYLSSAYGPFSVGGEPATKGFQVRDLNLDASVDAARMERRKSLLAAVDSHFSKMESSDALSAMDSYYQRAYALISSQTAREAFNINAEPDAMRDQYGRHAFGQRLLLARRLVEGGARFVTVIDGGWDHHVGIKNAMQSQLPPVDQGLAALIGDLDSRGLLAKTLVVMVSEFGRTVKLNKDAGRDHWPKAFSIVMAGAGTKRGLIYGQTDAFGSEPKEGAVSPEGMAATIYTQLGIDPTKRLMTPGNRPAFIVRDGTVIKEVLA
ncbi:MAG: DUF1501 domain-containing protein [Candidatus Hydrogenedentes bacterium]|nr:DUF1501 domain-containing protein [Candidatus Hydrogenedentota bacterium]